MPTGGKRMSYRTDSMRGRVERSCPTRRLWYGRAGGGPWRSAPDRPKKPKGVCHESIVARGARIAPTSVRGDRYNAETDGFRIVADPADDARPGHPASRR